MNLERIRRGRVVCVLVGAVAPGDAAQHAAAGTFAGDEVPIGVDHSGSPVPAPPPQLSAAIKGLLSGLSVLVAGGTVLAAMWLFVRRVTAAANGRQWGREWAAVAPRWR
jgi:hypothetical protein